MYYHSHRIVQRDQSKEKQNKDYTCSIKTLRYTKYLLFHFEGDIGHIRITERISVNVLEYHLYIAFYVSVVTIKRESPVRTNDFKIIKLFS